jgi:uncharacterized protein (DUF4415 family)
MKPVQYFSDEYLRHCAGMRPEQILSFLDQFRRLHAKPGSAKSRLISLKVDESLLNAFRTKCELQGARYQTQIKKLMSDWLESKINR